MRKKKWVRKAPPERLVSQGLGWKLDARDAPTWMELLVWEWEKERQRQRVGILMVIWKATCGVIELRS